MKPVMKKTDDIRELAQQQLEQSYSAALQGYLDGAGEAGLRGAYELGRAALASGLGVLEVALLHSRVLARLAPRGRSPEEIRRTFEAAREFFVECLCPYEIAHRGFRESITALRGLNEAMERELKRIAHMLHDDAGQLLVAVHLALYELARELSPAQQERMAEATGLLRQVEDRLRSLSHELRPTALDDLGLVPALELLAEGISKRTGLRIAWQVSLNSSRLPPAVETALYRSVQEALTNVARHARAASVTIRFEQLAQGFRCSIRDDGIGFDPAAVLASPEKTGIGLRGIRERLSDIGGTLEIHSAHGQGTELRFSIPAGER